jgi:acyl carrier protein
MNEILAIVRRQLTQEFPLDMHTPLLSSGLIDSFGVAGLLAALERKFQIGIDPGQIGVDNFDTPAQIHEYVETHLRGHSDGGRP